jgi:iron-sulfur cluster assembly accessory protein
MGTFHDDMGELHGITVVALSSDTVYVGRCHEMTADRLEMLDVDQHSEGQEGRTNDEYLERAAKFGVWKKHDRLILSLAEIQNVVPLGNYYKGVGSVPAPVAETPRPAPEPVDLPTAISDEAPVSLTPEAVDEVKRLLAEEENRGQGLRLGVSGGGCSGLVYNVEFDGHKEGDLVIDQDGFEIFLDRKSIIYLRGVILEFQKGLSGRGFQFRNPNASNTCGCGESFAV